MRFIKYIAITVALITGHFDIVQGSVSPQPSTGAAALADEYVHDALVTGQSAATFASSLPGVALFMQRHLRRPGSATSIGLANILNIPHFVFEDSMPADAIREQFTRTFAIIRDTMARHDGVTRVFLNGEGSFTSMIAAAPSQMQDGIRAILNEVIHATFDNIPGVTVQVNNMPYVTIPEGTPATFVASRSVMGPQPLTHMGRDGSLAASLLVNVYNPAARSDLSAVLSQLIPGGLVLPQGIPEVLVAPAQPSVSTTVISAVAEDTLPMSTRSSESMVEDDRPSGALTEEEEAQIAAAIAAFDDSHANMVHNVEPDVRPPIPSQHMTLVEDDNADLPPFDPSTVSDPDIRAAILASREHYMARRHSPDAPVVSDMDDMERAIAASLEGGAHHSVGVEDTNEEEQMLAAAIEQSMQRSSESTQSRPSETPAEAALDIDSIIVSWMATGSEDVSQLVAQLMEAGVDEDTSLAIAEQYL